MCEPDSVKLMGVDELEERNDIHGYTGYGWAMRREIFDEVGLYEAAVSGSADHFMAHAIFGHYGFCVENALKHDPKQIAHLKAWGTTFHQIVNSSLVYSAAHLRWVLDVPKE